MQRGDLGDAEDKLERALSLDPRNPFCYFYLAEIRYREGGVKQALILLSQAEVLFQGHPYWLGEVYTREGFYWEALDSPDRARGAYGKALEHNPWNEESAIPSGSARKSLIFPAVMPCRSCLLCKTGRGNRCLAQKMPGNSLGVYGGFSSHIPVPSIDLCEVRNRAGVPLAHLAVVADAGTTPYQAAKRADLQPGDNVIIIGVTGGVGVYMAQMAKALGAKTVIGIARNPQKLQRALKYGADLVISSQDKEAKDIRAEFRDMCKKNGLESAFGWKIFEVSGTRGGQDIALELLSFTGKLIVIGLADSAMGVSRTRSPLK